MPTYTRILMNELAAQGWTVELRPQGEDSCVAVGKKDGHTCVGESDGDLGALLALKRSIRRCASRLPCSIFPGGLAIKSANERDFAKAIFAFGYDQFCEYGRGVVGTMESQLIRNEDGSIIAHVCYLVHELYHKKMPQEARDNAMSYDPDIEAVFMTLSEDGRAVFMRTNRVRY